MQITSGTISFARKINLGDYNSKDAKVELSFSFDENEFDDEKLFKVCRVAWDKAAELLAMDKNSKPVNPVEAAALVAPKAAKAAEPKKGPGRPPSVAKKEPEQTITEAPTTTVDATAFDDTATEAEFADDTPPAEPAIPDGELNAICRNMADKLGTGGGAKIKALFPKYNIVPPMKLADMPHDKRAAFVAAVKALT